MNKTLDKIFKLILDRPLAVVIITALITVFALSVLPKINIDNSVDVFFNKKSDSYIKFQEWKDQFGSDEFIIVSFSDKDIFTQQNLKLIDDLTYRFEDIEEVDDVTSLTTVNNITGYENDFIVNKLIEDIPSDQISLEHIKKEALKNPLYLKNIISDDGKTTAILIELQHDNSDNSLKKRAMESVKDICRANFPSGQKYYISGLTAIEYYYALYMKEDLKTFMPFMMMVILSILYFSFRKFKIMILPFIGIGVSLSLGMAFLYFLGYSINNVTTLVPPLLMAIMIADSIHLVGDVVHRPGSENPILMSMRELFFPCLLTTLTTSVGFLSLTTSSIPPVKELGIVVGISVFFALIVTFTLLPALIRYFRIVPGNYVDYAGEEKHKTGFLDKFLASLGKFNEKNRLIILAGTLVLMVVCIVGILKIKVETSVLEYFKKNSPIYSSTTFIEKHISGVHTINISFKADKRDFFKDPEALQELDAAYKFLYSIPEVDKVTSVVDYIKDINMSFNDENPAFYKIPDSKELISQYMLLYGMEDLDNLVDSQWQWANLQVRVKEHNTIVLDGILKKISNYFKGTKGVLPEPDLLGQTVLEVNTNNAVTNGQLKSLGLAMLVIFLMMFLLFRSFSVGIVSIIPNILPILINFGIMGWLGIRLDSATSMIAAIGIGIIVDDTIHYLYSFGENIKATGDYTKAMYSSLKSKGWPIILTSVILFFGFGVVGFSKFVPTSFFGILSALLMLNALLTDLIILPCILLQFKPRFK